jgi:hypothetical protein
MWMLTKKYMSVILEVVVCFEALMCCLRIAHNFQLVHVFGNSLIHTI